MSGKHIRIVKDEEHLIAELCKLVEQYANSAIERDNEFKIGLSGGSLVKFIEQGITNIQTDWPKWKIFFCDERIVSFECVDSTYGMYKTSLMSKVPLTEDQFVKIDPHMTAEDAAKDYIQKMAIYFPPYCLPRFHLLLLGMGPDGHVCGLFPDHRILDESSVWVAPITNAPKPPSFRITLTFPVVNNAECCIFAISGRAKADIVKRILIDEEPLPAYRVKPVDGVLYWILDEDAAVRLKEQGFSPTEKQ